MGERDTEISETEIRIYKVVNRALEDRKVCLVRGRSGGFEVCVSAL